MKSLVNSMSLYKCRNIYYFLLSYADIRADIRDIRVRINRSLCFL